MLPVCYGDALFGMWKGFEELKALGWIDRTPRFVAAEVSGSLAAAMEGGDAMPPELPRNAPSIATSIGALQGTVQALDVLRRIEGRGGDGRRRRAAPLGADAGGEGRPLARSLVGRAVCRDRAAAGRGHDQAARALRGADDGGRHEGSRARSSRRCPSRRWYRAG